MTRLLLTMLNAFALLVSTAVVPIGASPSQTMSAPPALAAVLSTKSDFMPCPDRAMVAAKMQNGVGKGFIVTPVTLQNGPHLLVANAEDGLGCSCVNCDTIIFRHDGNAYVSVLEVYAYGVDVRTDGTVQAKSHLSASVIHRSTYHWSSDRYLPDLDELQLNPDSNDVITKPAFRNVRFAPGASSAILEGDRVAQGFEDEFDFTAAAGQTVTVTVLRHDRHFGGLRLDGPRFGTKMNDKAPIDVPLSATLPTSGSFSLTVSGADDTLSTYALKLEIH